MNFGILVWMKDVLETYLKDKENEYDRHALIVEGLGGDVQISTKAFDQNNWQHDVKIVRYKSTGNVELIDYVRLGDKTINNYSKDKGLG